MKEEKKRIMIQAKYRMYEDQQEFLTKLSEETNIDKSKCFREVLDLGIEAIKKKMQ